jgi:hypothetical protein
MHSVIVSMIECPAAANVNPLAADPGGRDQTECPPGNPRRLPGWDSDQQRSSLGNVGRGGYHAPTVSGEW